MHTVTFCVNYLHVLDSYVIYNEFIPALTPVWIKENPTFQTGWYLFSVCRERKKKKPTHIYTVLVHTDKHW